MVGTIAKNEIYGDVICCELPNVDGFLESVRSRKPTLATADVAHLSCALVHLGEIAYRTGRVLHFDPKTETFKNDAEANALLTKNYRKPWRVPEMV